ncbi:MAG TPA: YbaK/EbsC family protein [Chthoniobacteraceae bacterium]|jgi:Ala-tRNA(Pro) deacylase|nr:YbaK/EbsC family protein [Chthoniobacteraceae bacterium]
MSIPNRLLEFLNERRVPYQLFVHPKRFTAQELAEIEGVPGSQHAKVVMMKSDGMHRMAVLPSDCMVDLDKLERTTGIDWRIEDEDEFTELFPDCETGAMPPFGELYDLPMYLDQSLAKNENIVFEAGTHSDAIKMTYRDYEAVAHPEIADFAIKSH